VVSGHAYSSSEMALAESEICSRWLSSKAMLEPPSFPVPVPVSPLAPLLLLFRTRSGAPVAQCQAEAMRSGHQRQHSIASTLLSFLLEQKTRAGADPV
jgi:hypothetical protein